MLHSLASSSPYDTWAYLCHNSKCTCYTDVDEETDACSVCAPVAYPATESDSADLGDIPVAAPLDFDDTGKYLLSAKQFAKTMKQTARNAPKNSNPMAHLVLLSPEGTFDFPWCKPMKIPSWIPRRRPCEKDTQRISGRK